MAQKSSLFRGILPAALAVLAVLAALPALAGDGKTRLWEDPQTHQVYTEPGPGRVPVDVDAGGEHGAAHGVVVDSKAVRLQFSGVHYLGFVLRDPDEGESTSKFETRRNYFQVKGYFDKKNYMRLTLDTHQKDDGDWAVRLKYAYLWLADILPHTGIEIGQVHRPWIDYEEHHGWLYRSISKTFVESSEGAHLINSADLGVNLKTKTDHFSSEIALVNGEGYHGKSSGQGLSLEARLTWHALGTGRKHVKATRDRWLDVSLFGVKSNDDESRTGVPGGTDFTMAGIHFAWNTPHFLLAAMYVDADNDEWGAYDGSGITVNAEYRPNDRWAILARRDDWDQSEVRSNKGGDRTNTILGIAWRYNSSVRFILNTELIDYDEDDALNAGKTDETRWYATAEVHW